MKSTNSSIFLKKYPIREWNSSIFSVLRGTKLMFLKYSIYANWIFLIFFTTPGWSWESSCFLPTDGEIPSVRPQLVELNRYEKCIPDVGFRKGYFRGEHYRLCVDALLSDPEGSAQEASVMMDIMMPNSEKKFKWKTTSLDNPRPLLWGDVEAVHKYHFCEFSELPDFAISLKDWAAGFPESSCNEKSPCRNFGSLGPINSNHFGEQAEETYRAYHEKALLISKQCRELLESGQKYSSETFFEKKINSDYLFSYRWFGDSYHNCIRVASAYEGYGLHFLQDRWSVGHMWNRWGSPRQLDFESKSQAATVSIIAGIIHGAEAVTGVPGGLSSSKPSTEWGFKENQERYPGIGDMHAENLMTDELYKVQRDYLIGCSKASFYELMAVDYNTEYFTKIRDSLRARYSMKICAGGGWVTNVSLSKAVDLPLKSGPHSNIIVSPNEISAISSVYHVPIKIFLNVMEQVNVNLNTLRSAFVPLESKLKAIASRNPQGISAANDNLPSLNKIPQGGKYLKEALSLSAAPDLNISFNFNKTSLAQSTERTMIAAIAPMSCQIITPETIRSLIDQCQATHKTEAEVTHYSGEIYDQESEPCQLCIDILEANLSIESVIPSECQMFMGRPFDHAIGMTVPIDVCPGNAAPCGRNKSGCDHLTFKEIKNHRGLVETYNGVLLTAFNICRSGIDTKRKADTVRRQGGGYFCKGDAKAGDLEEKQNE
jgi:hypothetical protein